MEQKQTLWIVAAVGVFLLVVLGSARLMYQPAAMRSPAIAASPLAAASVRQPSTGWAAYPAVSAPARSEEEPPMPQAHVEGEGVLEDSLETKGAKAEGEVTRVSDMTVIAQRASIYDLGGRQSDGSTLIDLNALKISDDEGGSLTPKNDATAKAMRSAREEAASDVKAASPRESIHAAAEKPAPKKTAAAAKRSAPKTSPAKKTEGAKKARADTWWVQAAAYTNKKSADDARVRLGDNRITADVFTYKDAAGRVFYRVRVGPYTTRSEAEYWKARIGQISEFSASGSFVTTAKM